MQGLRWMCAIAVETSPKLKLRRVVASGLGKRNAIGRRIGDASARTVTNTMAITGYT